MAIGQQYISVRNWRRFQHYDPLKRSPAWIKNYTELLDDPHYLELTEPQRALLHGLWLWYAMARTYVPLSIEMINRKLNLKVKMASVEALVNAGFIDIVASKTLADGYQSARTEVEVEKEKTYLGEDLLLSAPTPTTPVANGSSKATHRAESFIRNGGHALTTYSLNDELERLSVPEHDRPRLRAMAEGLNAATTKRTPPTNAGEVKP